MALASKLLTAGCTATTAAGTNTLKTTAMVNAVVDAVLHEISSRAAVTPGQQQLGEAFKADMLTNVATIRIAIYGA
jgi:hypothetical protein